MFVHSLQFYLLLGCHGLKYECCILLTAKTDHYTVILSVGDHWNCSTTFSSCSELQLKYWTIYSQTHSPAYSSFSIKLRILVKDNLLRLKTIIKVSRTHVRQVKQFRVRAGWAG